MGSFAEVVVLVEGPTEQRFVKQLLAPYMAEKKVYLTPIILDKPGEKGGDIKFVRAKNDIGRHLKQRGSTVVTLLVDYYGIRSDWPGYLASKEQNSHTRKADTMCQATAREVQALFPGLNVANRFIPYVSMHELEALYFSDPACLAEVLGVRQGEIDTILKACGEPENINDSTETAPSARLKRLSGRFKKTTTGMVIAEAIGIPGMRSACPLFNGWLTQLEALAGRENGKA